MTSHETAGFIAGYQNKEATPWEAISEAVAGVGGAVARLGGEAISTILPWLILVPVAAGAGAGLVHSKMTSPAPMDIGAAQKSLEISELEEFATELKRRREAATRQGKKEKSDARTLRL
jgi:hypothetical protein